MSHTNIDLDLMIEDLLGRNNLCLLTLWIKITYSTVKKLILEYVL